MLHLIKNINKDIELLRKNQMEILVLKSTVTEINKKKQRTQQQILTGKGNNQQDSCKLQQDSEDRIREII